MIGVGQLKRRVLILILAAAVLAGFAPVATAKVTILNESGKEVDTVAKGECRISKKKGSRDFFLAATSGDRKFELVAFIDPPEFTGFGETYIIYYGGGSPQFFLTRTSDGEEFSNFKIPGTPAGTVGGGAIRFRRDGRRVGIGFASASNKSFTEGISFAGYLGCKYRKR